jgi:hypothetical protein
MGISYLLFWLSTRPSVVAALSTAGLMMVGAACVVTRRE